jgi:hypothetical protein
MGPRYGIEIVWKQELGKHLNEVLQSLSILRSGELDHSQTLVPIVNLTLVLWVKINRLLWAAVRKC